MMSTITETSEASFIKIIAASLKVTPLIITKIGKVDYVRERTNTSNFAKTLEALSPPIILNYNWHSFSLFDFMRTTHGTQSTNTS